MTDVELNLLALVGLEIRRRVCTLLLAGNDTRCFTVPQYVEAYLKDQKMTGDEHEAGWRAYITELAPTHLKSVGMVEVKPDVWGKAQCSD